MILPPIAMFIESIINLLLPKNTLCSWTYQYQLLCIISIIGSIIIVLLVVVVVVLNIHSTSVDNNHKQFEISSQVQISKFGQLFEYREQMERAKAWAMQNNLSHSYYKKSATMSPSNVTHAKQLQMLKEYERKKMAIKRILQKV
jgi:ABC-type nickel/cobalt efflux system permease component RcnA